MEDKIRFGQMLESFRANAGLSRFALAHEISKVDANASDRDLADLRSMGLDHVDISQNALYRYEKGENDIPARRWILTFIYYFYRKDAMTFQEANEWLDTTDYKPLESHEIKILFGEREKGETKSLTVRIPKGVTEVNIEDVVIGGFLYSKLTILVVSISIATVIISLIYAPAILERLERLMFPSPREAYQAKFERYLKDKGSLKQKENKLIYLFGINGGDPFEGEMGADFPQQFDVDPVDYLFNLRLFIAEQPIQDVEAKKAILYFLDGHLMGDTLATITDLGTNPPVAARAMRILKDKKYGIPGFVTYLEEMAKDKGLTLDELLARSGIGDLNIRFYDPALVSPEFPSAVTETVLPILTPTMLPVPSVGPTAIK